MSVIMDYIMAAIIVGGMAWFAWESTIMVDEKKRELKKRREKSD
jgi:hypothetical protein